MTPINPQNSRDGTRTFKTKEVLAVTEEHVQLPADPPVAAAQGGIDGDVAKAIGLILEDGLVNSGLNPELVAKLLRDAKALLCLHKAVWETDGDYWKPQIAELSEVYTRRALASESAPGSPTTAVDPVVFLELLERLHEIDPKETDKLTAVYRDVEQMLLDPLQCQVALDTSQGLREVAATLNSGDGQEREPSDDGPDHPLLRGHNRISGGAVRLFAGMMPLLHGLMQLYDELKQEASSHALTRLYSLNSVGVRHYDARSGWIFIVDESGKYLESIEEAAYNTGLRQFRMRIDGPGIVPHVFRTGEAFWTPHVSEVPFYEPKVSSTRSELAVPIYDPEHRLIGIYNLEANEEGAFTPAQVRELEKNVAFLVPHLLVLRELRRSSDFGTLPFHPEIHCRRFNPRLLLERFCRVVVDALTIPDAPAPSCTFWTCEPQQGRCWTLADFEYDQVFYALDTLTMNAAVARTATGPEGTIFRGTPEKLQSKNLEEELQFENLERAKRMGLEHAIIARLAGDKTLNIYFFDKRPAEAMPSDEVIRWVARQAEQLIGSFYRQRKQLALATMQCDLAQAQYGAGRFASFLQTYLRCTDSVAGSIFVRVPRSYYLLCAESTGLDGVGDPTTVKYHVLKDKHSFTCWMAEHPDPLRVNWTRLEDSHRPPDCPAESSGKSRERIVGQTPYLRRLLGKSVMLPGGTSLGCVRLVRSALSPPFTREDEELATHLCESQEAVHTFCNYGFTQSGNVTPAYHCSTRARIEQELLPQVVHEGVGQIPPVYQATVFERCERARPQYGIYAFCSKERLIPSRNLRLESHLIRSSENHPSSIILAGGDAFSRVCVPLRVWSGRQLVEAVLALDYADAADDWTNEQIREIFDWSVQLSAIWSWNTMRVPDSVFLRGGGDEEMFKSLLKHAAGRDNVAGGVRLRLKSGAEEEVYTQGPIPDELGRMKPCPDARLKRYGVELAPDGRFCRTPLMVGPARVGELECALTDEFAERLRRHVLRRSGEANTDSIIVLGDLCTLLAAVSGPWSRLVAGNLASWEATFSKADEDQCRLWTPVVGRAARPEVVP